MQFLLKLFKNCYYFAGNRSVSFTYQWMKILVGVVASSQFSISFLKHPAISIKKDFGNQVLIPKQAEFPYFAAPATLKVSRAGIWDGMLLYTCCLFCPTSQVEV